MTAPPVAKVMRDLSSGPGLSNVWTTRHAVTHAKTCSSRCSYTLPLRLLVSLATTGGAAP